MNIFIFYSEYVQHSIARVKSYSEYFSIIYSENTYSNILKSVRILKKYTISLLMGQTGQLQCIKIVIVIS